MVKRTTSLRQRPIRPYFGAATISTSNETPDAPSRHDESMDAGFAPPSIRVARYVLGYVEASMRYWCP